MFGDAASIEESSGEDSIGSSLLPDSVGMFWVLLSCSSDWSVSDKSSSADSSVL